MTHFIHANSNLRSGVFFQEKGRGREREGKIRPIHLFCELPTAPTINKLNCLSTVRSNGRSWNECDKRLAICRFLSHSNDDKCILFPFNADFQAFSYQILPETSRNLSDKRLKVTHAKLTRQLITLKSREKHSQSQQS